MESELIKDMSAGQMTTGSTQGQAHVDHVDGRGSSSRNSTSISFGLIVGCPAFNL